ncbi:MAG: hypothetical protein LC790_10035 [Actinobacteria bacterium]|nr:hypothetical protein [Actinomycetota bacterium]
MRRTVPPSAEIEEQIDALLAVGVGENPREALSELAKLGARLIIQRAVEDEFDAWLGRYASARVPTRGTPAADEQRASERGRLVVTLLGGKQARSGAATGAGIACSSAWCRAPPSVPWARCVLLPAPDLHLRLNLGFGLVGLGEYEFSGF